MDDTGWVFCRCIELNVSSAITTLLNIFGELQSGASKEVVEAAEVLLGCRLLEPDKNAGDKLAHQLAVLLASELHECLLQIRPQGVLELVAEHNSVRGYRALLFDDPGVVEDLAVQLLGYVAGDDGDVHLAGLEGLPGLRVAPREKHLAEVVVW